MPVGEEAGVISGVESAALSGRVTALGSELRRLHDRIRDVLDDARDGIDPTAGAAALTDDLVLRCRAVCTTLGAHHRDEDAALFPWLRRRHPDLGDVVDRLEEDHAMIGTLLADLDRVARAGAASDVVLSHLEGVDAILESHFRYEERELVGVLDATVGDGPPLPSRFWGIGSGAAGSDAAGSGAAGSDASGF